VVGVGVFRHAAPARGDEPLHPSHIEGSFSVPRTTGMTQQSHASNRASAAMMSPTRSRQAVPTPVRRSCGRQGDGFAAAMRLARASPELPTHGGDRTHIVLTLNDRTLRVPRPSSGVAGVTSRGGRGPSGCR
jgi:hypothetical protein